MSSHIPSWSSSTPSPLHTPQSSYSPTQSSISSQIPSSSASLFWSYGHSSISPQIPSWSISFSGSSKQISVQSVYHWSGKSGYVLFSENSKQYKVSVPKLPNSSPSVSIQYSNGAGLSQSQPRSAYPSSNCVSPPTQFEQ